MAIDTEIDDLLRQNKALGIQMLKERAHLAVKLSAFIVRNLHEELIVDTIEMFRGTEIDEIDRLAGLWKP